LTSPFGRTTCRNCGRARDAESLDPQRWCTECRRRVIRRSAVSARISALLVTLLLWAWIAVAIRPERFIVGWLLVLAVTYFIVHKIAQRVLFEVFRARGVPAGEVADE
jgi:cell division protein FtsB